MRKIKYIFTKLKTMRYKEFFKMIDEISKKANKSRIYLLFDMAYCALKFGSGYMDYFEFEFYLLKNKERKTYLTGGVNNEIIRKYNDKSYWDCFSDKIKFNKLFKDYLGRDYLDLREVSKEEFISFIKKHNKIIVKPIDECGGMGITVYEFNKKDIKDETHLSKMYKQLKEKKIYLVEEFITQHKEVSRLYPESVNTLRVLTFLDDDGICRIMNVILKLGNNGKVDNFCSGGMYTFVDEKGCVFVPAIDEKGRVFDVHPKTKESIVGFKIPHYDKLEEYVTDLANVVPQIRYVGWDVGITKDGFTVIEGNEYPGVFQVKTSISGIRQGEKTKYQKYMELD